MPQGTSTVEHLLKDSAPDWSAIDFDVLCGRCGYNLRTLTNPRCPECGLTFEWPAVLHRDGIRSEWLFEHNWRKAPLWSWCQTVCRSFWPRRFFKGLSLHDRVSPFALWVMLASAIPMQLVALTTFASMARIPLEIQLERMSQSVFVGRGSTGNPPARILQSPGIDENRLRMVLFSLRAASRSLLEMPRRESLTVVFIFESTILFSLGLFLLLWSTLSRCKVDLIHVVRTIAYSAPCIVTWWMLLLPSK